jgi:hypothetical protein
MGSCRKQTLMKNRLTNKTAFIALMTAISALPILAQTDPASTPAAAVANPKFIITGTLKTATGAPMANKTVIYMPRNDTKDKKGVLQEGFVLNKQSFGWTKESIGNPHTDSDSTGAFKLELEMTNEFVTKRGDLFSLGLLGNSGVYILNREAKKGAPTYKIERESGKLDLGEILVK